MVVCHRVCDYHHEHLEEEERLTTMDTTTGALAQGEGCHYDTMTGSTAMVTTMQDRLQERLSIKRPTTSLDYVIRLTDRLQSLRSKCVRFFSHFIRFGSFRQFGNRGAIVGNRGQSWVIVGNRGQSWAIVGNRGYLGAIVGTCGEIVGNRKDAENGQRKRKKSERYQKPDEKSSKTPKTTKRQKNSGKPAKNTNYRQKQ